MAANLDIVDAIRRSGVLDAAKVEEVRRLRTKYPETRQLARALIEQRLLTAYQINQLVLNRGESLVLGQYVILERLGEGGMGQVFKARQKALDRLVALKVIGKEHLDNPELVRRFKREMQAVSQLSHPNVVMAIDAEQAGDNPFLVMEYVDGVDLGALLKKHGSPTVALACDHMRQAALGLQHAHERGLVHRDVKPSNLLATWSDAERALPERPAWGSIIKITDMGVARLQQIEHESDAMSNLTKEGRLVGTPDYMAPEQATNSATADHRADLYSLGCTLYQLLANRVPFPKGTALEKLIQHRLDDPVPIESLRPDLPRELVSLIRRLMAKRPEERLQTAALAAAELDDLVRSGKLSTDPTPVIVTPPEPAAAPRAARAKQPPVDLAARLSSWPVIIGVIVGTLLLLAVAASLFFSSSFWIGG